MQITVRGKNIEVTPALREHVERKLSKLERYLDHTDVNAQVALGVERERHIVEVTLPVNGFLIRGEESSADMYASVDQVLDKLERQIRKYKTRVNRKQRHLQPPLTDGELAESDYQLVKSKRFQIKPMAVEEAILQMDLLGHDFFVFANAETDETNVVYRRHDGRYGLIEPDR